MKKMITGAVLLCLFASNAYALGDGFNVRGLLINPSVTVSGQYDDNITRSELRIISSWETIVNPAIDITAGSEINQFVVHYDFERGDFASSRNDSYSDHHVSGETHNELTSRFMIDTTASYTKSHDGRGTTFSGIATGFNTPDRWHEAAATGKLSYGGKYATGRIELHGGFAAKRYDNHRSLTAARDLNTENGGATFYYRIAPQTSALFEGDYDNFDYRQINSPLDSYNLTFYGGLTWEATAKTSGTVKAGWQRKKARRGNQAGGGFFSLDAQVAWAPLTYSVWTLKAGRRARETDSNGVSGSYIKTNDVFLDWTHKWNNRLSHSAEVGYAQDRYIGSARKDNTFTASFGLNYDLAPWLEVGAGYDYANRTSNAVNASYNESVYSISATGTL